MYKTFFYHKEFLKKILQSPKRALFKCRLQLRELVTFVSMRQKRVYMTVSSDLATDNRVHRSCSLLTELNYEVILLGRCKKTSPPMSPRDYSVKRFNLIFEKSALFYAALNVRFFLFLLFKRADYIFANDLDTLPSAYLISKIKRIAIIYDSHELFTETPELVNRPHIQNFWLCIERFILPRLKQMITVNTSIAEIFSKKYQLQTYVVRNVPARIEGLQALSKKALGLKEDERMLIIQGSGLNIQRGIEEAIMAMQFIDRAKLFLVGSGDVLGKAKTLVLEYQLSNKVIFIDRLPYGQLMQYTAAADLGLALDKPLSINYQLALPNKVFDYIQAHTPILCSQLIEIENIIRKYDCGVVISNINPEEIAKEVNKLLCNLDELNRLKNNCINAAQIEHWEKDKQVLTDLVLSVFI